jgi:hypothetical protein
MNNTETTNNKTGRKFLHIYEMNDMNFTVESVIDCYTDTKSITLEEEAYYLNPTNENWLAMMLKLN